MKRRASDRGAGETSAKAKALCAGISGNNAKRAGPFILGKQGGGSALGRVAAGGKTENKRHFGMSGSRCVTYLRVEVTGAPAAGQAEETWDANAARQAGLGREI